MSTKSQLARVAETLRFLVDAQKAKSTFSQTAKRMNFSDYILEDGTTIRIDGEMAVGSSVFVVDGENVIPAPDGTHTIPDVAIIKTENGLITEIDAIVSEPSEKDVETPPNVSAMAMNDLETMPDPMMAKIDAMEQKLAAIYDMLVAMKGDYTKQNDNANGKFKSIEASILKLAATPTAPSSNKNAFTDAIIADKNQRFQELTQIIKNLK